MEWAAMSLPKWRMSILNIKCAEDWHISDVTMILWQWVFMGSWLLWYPFVRIKIGGMFLSYCRIGHVFKSRDYKPSEKFTLFALESFDWKGTEMQHAAFSNALLIFNNNLLLKPALQC